MTARKELLVRRKMNQWFGTIKRCRIRPQNDLSRDSVKISIASVISRD
jgi:hypothetical protein